MKKRQSDIFGPGWCSNQRPDAVIKGEDGSIALWFRHRDAKAPESYDVAVPHQRRKQWVVYMLFLVVAIACLLPLILGVVSL